MVKRQLRNTDEDGLLAALQQDVDSRDLPITEPVHPRGLRFLEKLLSWKVSSGVVECPFAAVPSQDHRKALAGNDALLDAFKAFLESELHSLRHNPGSVPDDADPLGWTWYSSALRRCHLDEEENDFWVAKRPIHAGELLVAALPVIAVLDSSRDALSRPPDECSPVEIEDKKTCGIEARESREQDGLNANSPVVDSLLQTLAALPEQRFLDAFRCLGDLYPRRKVDLAKEADQFSVFASQVHHGLKTGLSAEAAVCDEISRLRQVFLVNNMAITFNADLLSYGAAFAQLASSGVYSTAPSLFNHSCEPNVNRVFVGTLALFRAIRDVRAGEALCISYLENENLALPVQERVVLLQETWAFSCHCTRCAVQLKESTPLLRQLRSAPDIADILSGLGPMEKLSLLTEFEKEMSSPELDVEFVLADRLRISIERGVLLMMLQRFPEAVKQFKVCLRIVKRELPVLDETEVCLRVQIARCYAMMVLHVATSLKDINEHRSRAETVLKKAIQSHSTLCGGGVMFFLRRYAADIRGDFAGKTDFAVAALVEQWCLNLKSPGRHNGTQPSKNKVLDASVAGTLVWSQRDTAPPLVPVFEEFFRLRQLRKLRKVLSEQCVNFSASHGNMAQYRKWYRAYMRTRTFENSIIRRIICK